MPEWVKEENRSKIFLTLIIITVIGNSIVALGPITANNLSDHIYWRFYKHAPPNTMIHNLNRYGRRPWPEIDRASSESSEPGEA